MGLGTTGQSITLANSIIGVGILAMPFCFQQCGVLLATLILLLMGLVSRLSCYFLLKSALLTKRRNFEFLAFHVFGSAGKLAVEVGIIGFLMGTCIAYFVVVGDLGPQIIAKLFNINQSDILRTSIMLIVSLVCVLPLGLLRNVDSLSNVSAATICFYFCLVMKVITEAASQLLTNDWHAKVELWKPSGVLQCVPIFSMALFCQAQLFEVFESLPSFSLEKMNVVTKNAINICTSVYFTLGLFGYIAFCSQEISGNILMSLSPTLASDVIKLGFVLSLAFSFPLIIFPCRASLYSFLYKKVHSYHHDHIVNHSIPVGAFRCITVGIVAAALCTGLLVPNIELVLGLLGSTVGVMICVVFPAACFVNVTHKNTNERLLAKCLLVLGMGILILGTYANLQAAEKTVDRFDDSKITQERIDKIVEDFFESKKINNEETIIKPVLRNDYNVQSDHNIMNKNSEILKDSEVQPPNPVPPESMSNEKVARIEPIENKKLNEMLPDDKQDVIDAEDKASGTHPKNLKSKLNEAKSSNELNIDNNSNKDVEKPKDEPKPQSNQDKIDLLKQEQLIETIKQHGEEQKELIKEQKEILNKIIKTKQEIQQKKKEVNSDEAKKIAVESIQQIANVAIRSLSGVTDKPNAQLQNEPLEKTANKAVEEIEKKAVETIEAIKDLKIKSKEPSDTQSRNLGVKQPKDTLEEKKQYDVQKANVQHVAISNNEDGIKTPLETENKPAINSVSLNNAKPVLNNDQGNNNEPLKNQVNQEIKPIDTNVEKKLDEHSHSPDEPQSYKQGEDTQKDNKLQLTNNIAHNVPIPLAIKGNSNLNNVVNQNVNQQSEANKLELINNIKDTLRSTKNTQEHLDKNMNNNNNNNGAYNNNVQNNVENNKESGLTRQKREVVDCTEKATLKPEDREICKSLLSNDVSSEILPMKVDLNDGLQRKLPLDTIHHVRSLKSYDETKQKR